MNVSFGDNARKRRGHAQVAFEITHTGRSLSCGFDGLLRGRELVAAGLGGLLCDLDVVAGDDARRGRRSLEAFERRTVGVSLRLCRRHLRLRGLHFRLGLRSLGDELWSLERHQQFTRPHRRSAINVHRLHEAVDPRIDRN